MATDEQHVAPTDPDSDAHPLQGEFSEVAPVGGSLAAEAAMRARSQPGGAPAIDRPPPPPPPPAPSITMAWVDDADVTMAPPRTDPLPPPPTAPTVLGPSQQIAFLESLPVAALLVDPLGNVGYLNGCAADLIGLPRTELLGRSVLDFVGVDDLDFVAELMNGGSRFEGQIMGPSRVRYVDASQREFWTQVWATNAPDDVCPHGFIVTLTGESVRDVLSVTATSVGDEGTLDWTLSGVADSARGLPLEARGVVLTVEPSAPVDSREFRVIGDWPIERGLVDDPSMPWRRALDTLEPCDVDDVSTSDLPGAVRVSLLDAGIGAIFVRPIPGSSSDPDSPGGVFVIFRDTPGPASANQDDHIADAVRLASFAFTMARRQIELTRASYRDALTGVANRAAFNDRLRSERRATDVLFVDLDHFKAVNDTYGHDVGDRVLATAAERIQSTLRRDARVFRTGGDEFVVLCESTGDDPAERIALADRIVDVLMQPIDVDIHRVRIGATIGIAASGTRSLVDTVRAADSALYRAKRRGRSGWAHEGR